MPAKTGPIFAALGDDVRLRILARLAAEGPLSITALTAGSRITRQAVTKHLQVMQSAGLVRSHWHGRENRWRLNQRRLREARRYLDAISRQWDDALLRLRDLVEDR